MISNFYLKQISGYLIQPKIGKEGSPIFGWIKYPEFYTKFQTAKYLSYLAFNSETTRKVKLSTPHQIMAPVSICT